MKARAHIKTAVRASDKAIGWVARQFLSPKPFIDANWYTRRYLDGDANDSFHHYMKIGWKLGYRPNPFLDALWYRRRYGCVGNPLLHYIRRGARHPHPLFDARWYLERYPDVARRRCDPLLHFLCFGRYEGRSPHPLFNSEWYAARYAQDGAGDDPFLHYLEKGAAERFDPHPLFDTAWYVEQNPEIAATGACALTHFVEEGGMRGRSPHPLFDAGWYLRQYPDVAQAKVNPLMHYLQAGASEGRDPHPHFQTSWYRGAYLGDRDANPLVHFVESDDIGAKPNFVFDPIWYERTHRHLIPEGERPLSHFLRIGRFAGLQPGPFFDPHAYDASTKTQAADPLAAFLNDIRLGHDVERACVGRMLLTPLSLAAAPTERSKEVVINSLYGIYRELGGFVAALENMRKGSDAPVRLMTHDFLLACPSQHLLDASQKYCGLPAIESVKCRECVRLNENIASEWRETFQMSTWRLLSRSLIDLCDEVRVFDESGEEILSRIFDMPTHIRRIAPHRPSRTLRPVRISNRDRLTIGILGTLTFAKGLDVVNALARHARMKRLDCAIVVIGDVRATVDPFVQVHGAYDAQRLPDIMEAYGINLVFISSVVPETFCYALSEAMEMRMPIVAYDLGAQGRRVRRYERGMVIAPDPPVEEIFRSLAACWRRFAVTAAEERAL